MSSLETCIRVLVAVADDDQDSVDTANTAISEYLSGFDPGPTTRLKALRALRIEHFARVGHSETAQFAQTVIEERMRLLIEGGTEG